MQVMRLWAGGDTWKVTGEGFDPNGEFLDAADDVRLYAITDNRFARRDGAAATGSRPRGIRGAPRETRGSRRAPRSSC